VDQDKIVLSLATCILVIEISIFTPSRELANHGGFVRVCGGLQHIASIFVAAVRPVIKVRTKGMS